MSTLILGGDGMLGFYLAEILEDSIPLKGRTVDISDPASIDSHITEKTRWIVNCIGCIPHRNPYLADMILANSIFPQTLFFHLRDKFPSIRLLHITTDCVFQSSDPARQFSESDAPSAGISGYGVSKWCGEPKGCQIIRTSIIGEETKNFLGLVERVKSAEREMDGWTDHIWNGVTCLSLAKLIQKIIAENIVWTGPRHIFSPEPFTKYLLVNYIRTFYNPDLVVHPTSTGTVVNRQLTTNMEILPVDDLGNTIQEMWEWGKNRFNRSKTSLHEHDLP